ncbi:hypothetical protein Hanom_Chr14g01294391 [Helianthus anomalus]
MNPISLFHLLDLYSNFRESLANGSYSSCYFFLFFSYQVNKTNNHIFVPFNTIET